MEWWLFFTSMLMALAAVVTLIGFVMGAIWLEDTFDIPSGLVISAAVMTVLLTFGIYLGRQKAAVHRPAEAAEIRR